MCIPAMLLENKNLWAWMGKSELQTVSHSCVRLQYIYGKELLALDSRSDYAWWTCISKPGKNAWVA